MTNLEVTIEYRACTEAEMAADAAWYQTIAPATHKFDVCVNGAVIESVRAEATANIYARRLRNWILCWNQRAAFGRVA
jgi:hypothetical protein